MSGFSSETYLFESIKFICKWQTFLPHHFARRCARTPSNHSPSELLSSTILLEYFGTAIHFPSPTPFAGVSAGPQLPPLPSIDCSSYDLRLDSHSLLRRPTLVITKPLLHTRCKDTRCAVLHPARPPPPRGAFPESPHPHAGIFTVVSTPTFSLPARRLPPRILGIRSAGARRRRRRGMGLHRRAARAPPPRIPGPCARTRLFASQAVLRVERRARGPSPVDWPQPPLGDGKGRILPFRGSTPAGPFQPHPYACTAVCGPSLCRLCFGAGIILSGAAATLSLVLCQSELYQLYRGNSPAPMWGSGMVRA